MRRASDGFAHAQIVRRLDQIGRRGAEIELPAQLQDIVEPLLFGGRADQDAVAGEAREFRIHRPRHAVLDRDDVLDVGEAIAELRAHQVAGIRVAPERDADIDLLGDGPVVFVERLVLRLEEMQDRRVYDDVVGADLLGMAGEVYHHVHVLIGAGHDGLATPRRGLDRELEAPLALLQRHREELALLAGDEQPVDLQVVEPVADVLAKAVLVHGEGIGERGERCCPDALHMGAGIGLGVLPGVFHEALFPLPRDCGARTTRPVCRRRPVSHRLKPRRIPMEATCR